MKNNLIEEYKKAAEFHGIGTIEGDYKKANSAYENLNKVYLELKNSNDLDLLKPLLKDDNLSIKTWAATHLLSIDESESIKILREVGMDKSIIGFGANIVIDEWNSGRLKY